MLNYRKASDTMNSDLSFAQIALLIAYAGGMAGGQVLFKMAALKGVADGPMVERLLSMMLNRFFAAAVLLYAALTVLWVWILTSPLSRAYVFVALAFAVTAIVGCIRLRGTNLGAARYWHWSCFLRTIVCRWMNDATQAHMGCNRGLQ